jgi:hypothetical protein
MTTTRGGLLTAALLATSTGGTSEPQHSDVPFEDTFTDGDYVWTLTGSSGHLLPSVLGSSTSAASSTCST